jgi:hypothetical protein
MSTEEATAEDEVPQESTADRSLPSGLIRETLVPGGFNIEGLSFPCPTIAGNSDYHRQFFQQMNTNLWYPHSMGPPPPVLPPTAPTVEAEKTTRRPKKNKKGKGGATTHFTEEELDILLNVIDTMLPLGAVMWQNVGVEYNKLAPRPRDLDSLRRKYNSLHQKKMPTGDPNMSKHVRLAKHINYKILEKSELSTGDTSDEDDVIVSRKKPPVPNTIVTGTDATDDPETPTDDADNTGLAMDRKLPPSISSVTASSTLNRKKARRMKTVQANNDSQLLAAFIASEKAAAERAKLKDKRDRANMKAMMGMFNTAVQAYMHTNSQGNGMASMPSPFVLGNIETSSSSEEELSSINTDDSPPTKRLKKAQGKSQKSNKKK